MGWDCHSLKWYHGPVAAWCCREPGSVRSWIKIIAEGKAEMGGETAFTESGGAPDTGKQSWPAWSCPAPFLNSVFPSGSQSWRSDLGNAQVLVP